MDALERIIQQEQVAAVLATLDACDRVIVCCMLRLGEAPPGGWPRTLSEIAQLVPAIGGGPGDTKPELGVRQPSEGWIRERLKALRARGFPLPHRITQGGFGKLASRSGPGPKLGTQTHCRRGHAREGGKQCVDCRTARRIERNEERRRRQGLC